MSEQTPKRDFRHATVRVGGIAAIPSILRGFSVDPSEIMAAAGIDENLLDDPDNLITFAARGVLVRRCIARTGCQHFGLLIGQRMDMPALGLVGLLMRSMPNVREALRVLESHFHVHSPGATPTVEISGNLARIVYHIVEPTTEAADQIGAGAVAMMLNMMRSLCGPDFQALEASFAHRRPADIRPFRQAFHCLLYFDAPRFSLAFAPKWLDARPPSADSDLQATLQKQVDAFESKHKEDVIDLTKSLMRSALTAGHCSEEKIAELLGVGPRTLMRRLQVAGTSFRELVNEVRYELAMQLLKDSSLSIGEISDTLGYSRASTFTRAFRRWDGSSPSAWRATNKA